MTDVTLIVMATSTSAVAQRRGIRATFMSMLQHQANHWILGFA